MSIQKLTDEQAAVVSAYTRFLCGSFSVMHAAIEKKLGHPVWTHQMGDEKFAEKIREAFKEDFLALCPPHDKERS